MEKENLNNILTIVNYLKKKVLAFKKNYEQAEREYKKQKKLLTEKTAEQEKAKSPTKSILPIKPVKKTDELDVYMQKNINLKNKIKILEKDVELWK